MRNFYERYAEIQKERELAEINRKRQEAEQRQKESDEHLELFEKVFADALPNLKEMQISYKMNYSPSHSEVVFERKTDGKVATMEFANETSWRFDKNSSYRNWNIDPHFIEFIVRNFPK